jgi:hypothetical protein
MEKSMKYQIYSGFCKNVDPKKYANLSADEWFEIWYKNTISISHSDIFIFGPDVPNLTNKNGIYSIGEYTNLGHGGDYWNGSREGRWCGWVTGVALGMIHAYACNSDFIYKEQDCLWFGDTIISQMYQDLGDTDIVMGTCKLMGTANSLFLVPRNKILDVIASLIPTDAKTLLPEDRFKRIPNSSRLSFGYDRDRPFDISKLPFYIQQVTDTELESLKSIDNSTSKI